MFARSTVGLRSVGSFVQRRAASTGNVSPFSIAALETRWGKLPEAEQGAIADRLSALQKGDWKQMSLDEKRAAYFIAYGPYGARNPPDPALKWSVLGYSTFFVAVSYGLYLWWETQKPIVPTMNPEWKAAEDKIAIEEKQNPFKGAYAAQRK
ncbi:Cytochrome c oxidase subunit 5A [Blyttiomyces sp. JEL0837]|nr:Cytochrome c oxidase subunit 5A [Blyttiomyces sp. JEL0837]